VPQRGVKERADRLGKDLAISARHAGVKRQQWDCGAGQRPAGQFAGRAALRVRRRGDQQSVGLGSRLQQRCCGLMLQRYPSAPGCAAEQCHGIHVGPVRMQSRKFVKQVNPAVAQARIGAKGDVDSGLKQFAQTMAGPREVRVRPVTIDHGRTASSEPGNVIGIQVIAVNHHATCSKQACLVSQGNRPEAWRRSERLPPTDLLQEVGEWPVASEKVAGLISGFRQVHGQTQAAQPGSTGNFRKDLGMNRIRRMGREAEGPAPAAEAIDQGEGLCKPGSCARTLHADKFKVGKAPQRGSSAALGAASAATIDVTDSRDAALREGL